MTGQELIKSIGFDRAKSIHSMDESLSIDQSIILGQVRDFGIDSVYFNTDSNQNSFPSVFLKEVKSFDESTLKEIAKIQKKVWNYKKVLFLYAYSKTEIRIYNCSEKPLIITKEGFDYDKELKKIELRSFDVDNKLHFEEINLLFSSVAIDSGVIWTLEEALSVREKINLKRRVDKYLVESLVHTAEQLEKEGLEIDLIHKIILRSLFLLYLEDRKATDEIFYSKIKKEAKSYFDILDDVKSTYRLYHKLEYHFNGNVFTFDDNEDKHISGDHLRLIKKCFISGNDGTPQINLFENWKVFDFSIIQIELLSEIYENFLFRTDPELKKNTGTYYTPPSLVEFILNDKLPVNKDEKDYNIKILDPSCGSGIFLVESFKRLVKRHENFHKKKLTDFNTLKKLLTDHIFGIELHPQAIKVAAFSLYLALVDNLNPKTVWQNKSHSLPNLINNPDDKSLKEQGKNLFCRDTISVNEDIEGISFDLVIGNPPFGTSKLSASIRNYCDEHKFPKEMVLPFLHKATKFANNNGQIVLIFNTKVLTNTGGTYKNFRKWLFNDCYVEKVFNFSILRKAKKDFGGQLFGDATGPISIIHYQKNMPSSPSSRIPYYAPKTYIKSTIIDGLIIDYTDLKFLPREECQKPESKIWKVAMWGGINDWELLKSIPDKSLGDLLSKKGFTKGLGLQFLDKSTSSPIVDESIPERYVKPQSIERFKTHAFSNLNEGITEDSKRLYSNYYNTVPDKIPPIKVFRRTGAKGAFKAPHILIKEGLKNWQICSSYLEEDCSFNSKVVGIHNEDSILLKGLVCLLNSQFATYFIFLTSASIGIEREEIKPNEIYNIPLFLDKEELYELGKMYDKHISDDFLKMEMNRQSLEKSVDDFIFKILVKKDVETTLIEDFISFTLPLLKKNMDAAKSYAGIKQIKKYSERLTHEIDTFLEGQGLHANATVFEVNGFNPLMLIKVSFSSEKKKISKSNESVQESLQTLDKHLWERDTTNIYFRKKLNYKRGNEIYIIRPSQERFWSESMALEDASELILEILNEG